MNSVSLEQFNAEEILKLKAILKWILPAGDSNMPEADLVLKDLDLEDGNHRNLIEVGKELCNKATLEHLSSDENLNLFKKANFRVFSVFVNAVLINYYSKKEVLSKLATGSNPPFPEGNFVKEGDIYLLEQVFLKGKIYKD